MMLIEELSGAIAGDRQVYNSFLRATSDQMVDQKAPSEGDIRELFGLALEGIPWELKNDRTINNLWRHVFGCLVEDALEDFQQMPLGEADMQRILAKYGPTNEEPYDSTIEDLYLSAVNDHKTYKLCIEEAQKVMQQRRRKVYAGRVKFLIKESNPLLVQRSSSAQLVQAWLKIFDHLMEPAIYGLETECLCSEEELNVIKKFYMPKQYCEQLGQEIDEHLTKAQDHFDTVETKLEEIAMSNNLKDTPVKRITYIYGNDIESLTAGDIMAVIKSAGDAMEELRSLGITSKYVKDKLLELNALIGLLTEKLASLRLKPKGDFYE